VVEAPVFIISYSAGRVFVVVFVSGVMAMTRVVLHQLSVLE
jgi:hypothetical protein